MMPMSSDLTVCIPSPNAERLADESIPARLAWMGELEASLDGSRKALLALDLSGIERGTREQVGLIRKFEGMKVDSIARAPDLEKELRRQGTTIMGAVRLQAALLARAQGKLRVLANMLAGTSADYGQLLARQGRGQRR